MVLHQVQEASCQRKGCIHIKLEMASSPVQCDNWSYTKILPRKAIPSIALENHAQHIEGTSRGIGSLSLFVHPCGW
jgi:hypothetical protein